ncbi:transglutaminase-like cysteine peptidase [Mesorhizobium sp. SP-1A]|uniref:transglutaminase-like cysteine peptidase n=1 Tax=Mesorhizobium sp. SP-1A TaxID=3077840 RepID=UPI0028F70717|nr:transglutaminase-like cysteine peptidase [Mesorhizobium sp. SP-1A]
MNKITISISAWMLFLWPALAQQPDDPKTIDRVTSVPATQSPPTPSKTQSQASPQQKPQPTGAFSSILVPIKNLPVSSKWREVYAAIKQAAFADCEPTSRCVPIAANLAQVIRDARQMPLVRKLTAINQSVNMLIAYKSDMENYGELDFWASPMQTLEHGSGDCEDYVILKVSALAAGGVPTNTMSMVVLMDVERQVFHAVLVVTARDGNYILDNMSDDVVLDRKITDYLPLYSLSEDRYWLHGRERNDGRIAAPGAKIAEFSGDSAKR